MSRMELPGKYSKVTGSRKFKQSTSESWFELSQNRHSNTSCESVLTRLSSIDLTRFCPKNHFYIIFVSESSEESGTLLDEFVETSRNYEIVSSVTFITREDVLDLLDTSKNYIFPSQLKPLLLEVIENIRELSTDNVPWIYEAQMIKLKLIQVMYQQYVSKVKQNQKEKNLEDLLNYLVKECKRKQKKDDKAKETNSPEKSKSPVREDTKKKNKNDKGIKEEYKDEDIDYTSIPLDNDGISFEENIFDYVWFYCIKGYYSNEIIENFTKQLSCPISAIIKITDNKADLLNIPDDIRSFWKNIDLQFCGNTTPYNSLQDTMLMQFTPSYKCVEKKEVLDEFQHFVDVLRRIIDIKLTHLKYLRHLIINKIQNTYAIVPLDCMQTYHRSLGYVPVDCISNTLILDALLNEVCCHLDIRPGSKTASSRSLMLSKSSVKSVPSIRCVDPLHDFQAFANFRKKTSVPNNKHDVNNFLTHDHNTLLKILKSYKHIGSKIFDISLNSLKRIPIFETIMLMKENNNTLDIPHTHDLDPSCKFEQQSAEALENFLYMFLFKTFSHTVPIPNTTKKHNLIKNLITFDLFRFWTDVQTKYITEKKQSKAIKVNMYDTSMVHFRWKEKLSSDVMLQEVFDATKNFLYYDQKYSPETDNFLVIFSDKLDAFGLNTKIFENTVRTPICLRDFCRYTTVEEREWLRKHETKILDEHTFKFNINEVCSGAYKVKTQMKFYEEYSYLLDGNIKEEIEDNKASDSPTKPRTSLEESHQVCNINFGEVHADLQKYPSYKNLIHECENAPELMSYNLGTNAIKITGHITTFCSHDGVKVTVDNTRFLQNPEKCTVNVISGGHTITLHSSEVLTSRPYVLSLVLKDGSRISFVVKKQECETSTKRNTNLKKISEDNEVELNNTMYEPPQNDKDNDNEEQVEPIVKQVVHCVDEEYLQNLIGDNQMLEMLKYVSINKDPQELMEAIINARENNGVIYKVNKQSSYLKRLNPDLKVPIEHALKTICPRETLNYTTPKQYETHTKRFESQHEDKSDLEITESVDFRVCLPNGLFIRTHPDVIDRKNLMVKQEYSDNKPNFETVQHEEFRLFSNQGFICIKKIDGTVTILKSNGDIIDFEKPNDGLGEDNNYSLKPCHCSTLDDYRNKLNKILKEEDNSDYFTSRRGHITHKQNHVLDKKLLKLLENFDVPYLKKSVTRFDGKKIKIQGNKISQKQLYHMTSQQDFLTEEIFFERSDEFKSTFERNGSQKIIFPDGTVISNSVNIADELVDDFVYVTISFQYEHPNYETIKYDFDKTLKIVLKDGVVVQKHIGDERFRVNIKTNILVLVSKEQVSLQKTCDDCSATFQCNLNIEPFYENIWNPSKEFLHVHDTYDKHFYSDFIGNCSRSEEYMRASVNSLFCNHYKRNNYYKKLFIINKDFSGLVYNTNDMVQSKIKEISSAPNSSVNHYNMISNGKVKVVDCRQKKHINYCDRFFNNSVRNYFHQNPQKKEFYTTFRVFHLMFDSVKEIETHVANLRQTYFSDAFASPNTDDIIFKNIGILATDLEIYYKAYEKELLAEQEQLERRKKEQEEEENRRRNAKCPCIKQRITMADKINNWREVCAQYKSKLRSKQIPSYFKSEFCKISE